VFDILIAEPALLISRSAHLVPLAVSVLDEVAA
jgi:hypothetical protein